MEPVANDDRPILRPVHVPSPSFASRILVSLEEKRERSFLARVPSMIHDDWSRTRSTTTTVRRRARTWEEQEFARRRRRIRRGDISISSRRRDGMSPMTPIAPTVAHSLIVAFNEYDVFRCNGVRVGFLGVKRRLPSVGKDKLVNSQRHADARARLPCFGSLSFISESLRL